MIRKGKRKGKGKGKKKKEKKTRKKGMEKGKGKGRWKEDSLRNVGRTDAHTDAHTHGHKGDFILCPMTMHCIGQTKNFPLRPTCWPGYIRYKQTNKRTTTMPIARPLLKYGRLKTLLPNEK